MKNKSFISLFAFLLGMGVVTSSCEDMLTPNMERYVEDFNGKDTVNFYLGILRNLQGVVEQNVILGEVRGDLAATTSYTSDSISGIANFENLQDGDNALLNRAAYYKVINQCNFYLAKVDTMAKKNDNYYMRKETGQVRTIRAWTYMQLVQNYGTVPYITKPVGNANTGWETNSPEGELTLDNILQKLGPDLETSVAYEDRYGVPQYGSFSTGKSGVDVTHRFMLFPARVVLADLYLLTAKNTEDYEKAAMLYYEYLNPNKNSLAPYVSSGDAASYNKLFGMTGEKDTYYPSVSSWIIGLSYLSGYNSYGTTTEIRTAMPSAANSSFGKVLTRIPQLYGFDPHSSNSTETGENSDGESVSTTSGEITITANYKNRQIAPSNRYVNLNTSQIYSYASGNTDNREIEYPTGLGDVRLTGTAPLVKTEEGNMRFIQKFGSAANYINGVPNGSFYFRYLIPIYRGRQIYLRFAEALNRAGHPRYAFAVLRNGLSYETIPGMRTDTINSVFTPKEDADGNPIYDEDGNIVYELQSTQVKVTVDSIPLAGANYISVDAMARATGKPFLDFNISWANSVGIHGLGSGDCGENIDTLYNYGVIVAKRILDEAARVNGSDAKPFYKENSVELDLNKIKNAQDSWLDPVRDYITSLYTEANRQEAVLFQAKVEDGTITAPYDERLTPVPTSAALQAEINAVETLIADEMALETAFEGTRYYDLMRIANHKENAGLDGFNWFAWLIARRNLDCAPYENVNDKGDNNLYSKLLIRNNWYLQSPQY